MTISHTAILRRTLIAAAVAAFAASAGAADADGKKWAEKPSELEEASAPASWDDLKDDNAYKLSSGTSSYLSIDESKTFEGRLWVTGANAKTRATGIWASAGKNGEPVVVTNKGEIYVTATDGAASYSQHAMAAADGATVQNDGLIFAKNAYGMAVGNENVSAGHVINNGEIYVEMQGAAIELGGADGSTAVNNGKIYVASPVEVEGADPSKFAHGVLIQDQKDGEFTNAGLIQAAEGASAIEIKGSADGTVVNLLEGSRIDGAINVTATGSTTFNIKNVEDTLSLVAVKSPTKEGARFTLNVLEDSNITLEDGKKSVLDVVNVDGARLNASVWGDDNTFKDVNVRNGGIFNVTKLNSGGDKDHLETTPHNQLLLKAGSHFTIDGGKLYVADKEYHGKLKVGSLSKTGASLALDNGRFSYSDLTVGSNSAFTVGKDADVALESLLVYQKYVSAAKEESAGGAANIGGTVNVEGHLSISDEIKFETADAKLNLNGGTLTVGGGFLFEKAEGAESWSATDAWTTNVAEKKGVVEVADNVGDYTIAAIKNAQKLLNNGDGNDVQLVFLNGTLKVTAQDDLTAGNVDGLRLADHAVKAENGTASFKKDTTAAAIDFQNAETSTAGTAAISTDGAALTLSGNSGDVFAGLKETTKTVAVAGSLTLGTDSASAGTVNVENLTVSKTLDVVGRFKAQNVELTGAEGQAKISGDFALETLKGGKADVAEGGVLTFSQASTNISVANGGAVVVQQAVNEKGEALAQIQGEITAEAPAGEDAVGAVLTTNREAAAAFVAKHGAAGKNVIYADGTLKFGAEAKVDFSGKEEAAAVAALRDGEAGAQMLVGADTIVAVDAANFIGTDRTVFDGATLQGEDGASILLLGVMKTGEKIQLADSVANNGSWQVTSQNIFVGGRLGAEGELETTFREEAIGAGSGRVEEGLRALYARGMSRKSAAVLDAIGDAAGPFAQRDEETGAVTLSADGVQAVSEYFAMPAAAGAYNMAYDAAEQVTGAVSRRSIEPSTGLGVWADVFYASNEAKTMYGDSGYDADIYGGVIGFDGTFSCGAKLGLALSVGSADSDSKGSVGKYSTDADFWGVSLYTGKAVGPVYFSADVSYIALDNDIGGHIAGASVAESIDSSVATVGLRGDVTAYDGVVKVAPHAGIRYSRIEMDDYRDFASETLNVFEAPLGVKITGAFESAAGWTVAPALDFTVVPQAGDKEVHTLAGDMDVLDNVYNATIGVSASRGSFSFGLSYRCGFGDEDRRNSAFRARAAYLF